MRDIVWREIVPIEIVHDVEDDQVHVSTWIRDFASMRLTTVRSNAVTVRRTKALASTHPASWAFLTLQASGRSEIEQAGRSAVLTPGRFALYDTTGPYRLRFAEAATLHHFRLPRALLAVDEDVLQRGCARDLGAGPVGGMTAELLARLAVDGVADRPGRLHLEHAAVDLVRACLAETAGRPRSAEGALIASLPARLEDHVIRRLGDPTLSAGNVAAAHHISVRYLHKIYAGGGTSFGETVRQQRLAGVERDLMDSVIPIAAVARRWGFTDAAYFGRLFRRVHGMSPGQWRAEICANRPSPDAVHASPSPVRSRPV